jgi:hypothetical protein
MGWCHMIWTPAFAGVSGAVEGQSAGSNTRVDAKFPSSTLTVKL